jgi:hypothetical protein
MRNGRTQTLPTLLDGLDPRCATCWEAVDHAEALVSFGDLLFHFGCAPGCRSCGRVLGPGEAGWRFVGEVVSEPWGWSLRPTKFWCRQCLEGAPRDRPSGGE